MAIHGNVRNAHQAHVIAKKPPAPLVVLSPEKFDTIPLIVTKISIYRCRDLDTLCFVEN